MHPCQSCGACCASFRVSFYRGEALHGDPEAVPAELTEVVAPFRVAMRRDGEDRLRCVALEGEVGSAVACSIYARRPSPCREFRASWEDGRVDARCDAARARHGLHPLRPDAFGG